MALLQALIAMLGRSAGRFLNAIFGWAVRALFGATSGAEQAMLTALVAVAALWPLLAVGVAAPRITAWVLAFVPISNATSSGALRIVWIALALLVPALVGIAMAAKTPPEEPRTAALVRAARGYPMTLGIALAFWLTFISVPALRFRSALRRHEQTFVPLVTSKVGYEQTADRIREVLEAHRFDIAVRQPTFWLRAPLAILRALGAGALDRYAPERLAYFVASELEVVIYPSSVLLRGSERKTTLAHGLIVESLTSTDAYQTTDALAQDVERQIRSVWAKIEENPRAHENSPWLATRVREITDDIAQLSVSYDEWQIVYRQALQLSRALRGEPQLLSATEEQPMARSEDLPMSETHSPTDSRMLSTPELISEIASKATQLVTKEVDLLRQESKEDLRSEIASVKIFAVAAVAAIVALNLLFLAAVIALSAYMKPLVAALSLAGGALVIAIAAAALAWRKHVAEPLDLTRKTVKEDVEWAKEQMA